MTGRTHVARRRLGALGVLALTLAAVLAVSGSARAAEAEADYQPTFAKDVASILQQKCQVCHQPNSIAPMSLLTYQEARPWARSIKARVVAPVAHRHDGRHSAVQERPVAVTRADRHYREMGGWRRAAR